MTLPFPHGDASGQIGHNSNYSTSDTPGSTGGRFIGFGEAGTSEAGNRAHWALSANIDYVHTKITQEIAVPKGYDRTSPGGGESTFQFPSGEEIWVGDDSYPGSAGSSDLEGMHMLFDVLDSNYNELTDGADNEIRVKLVRESTNTTDMYQGGSPFVDSFQDQPIIHFIAVDPATGATVTDPYTIPAATNYKVQCGVKSSIAELPADALVRYKVQGASEVEAGMFLQDGTRPMTGNLDLDGNNLINADVVSNVTGEPLNISSDHNLLFKDQYLSAGLALSESGQTALYQPVAALIHPSLVGAVNTNAEARELMSDNRCMDRTGNITTSGSGVTYPALKVMLQGQVVDIAGDTVTASGGANTYVLYVESDGAVTFEVQTLWNGANPPANSVLIWKGTWDGASTWTPVYDLRWPGTRRGDHTAIYVGSGVGADFTSINEALDWLNEHDLGAEKLSPVKEIVVVGEAEVTSTITLPGGTTLRGVSRAEVTGYTNSLLKTSYTFTPASHIIYAEKYCTIKDLDIKWVNTTASQDAAYAAIFITSAGGVIENVQFDGSGSGRLLANCIMVAVMTTGPVIRKCIFDGFHTTAIKTSARSRTHIEYCTFFSEASGPPTYHIDLISSGTSIDSSGPSHTVFGCYFYGARPTANIRVCGPNVLIDSCHCSMTGATVSAFVLIAEDGVDPQTRAGATVRNCYVNGGYKFLDCTISNVTLTLSLFVENCLCVGLTSMAVDLAGVVVAAASQIVIDRNSFEGDDVTSDIAVQVGTDNVRVSNNVFTGWIQYCVYVLTAANQNNLWITHNIFENSCTKELTVDLQTDVQASAIYISGSDDVNNTLIYGNVFRSLDGSAIRNVVTGNTDGSIISNNVFDSVGGRYLYNNGGSAGVDKYAVVALEAAGGFTISNNRFHFCGAEYDLVSTSAHAVYLDVFNATVINGNEFGSSISSNDNAVNDTWRDLGIYGNGHVLCSGNNFFRDLNTPALCPDSGFTQIYKSGGTGTLVLTGCVFWLTANVSPLAPSGYYSQVVVSGGGFYASGCYTKGDWVTPSGVAEFMWNVASATGNIIGCGFDGPKMISLDVTGFTIGNYRINQGAGGADWVLGSLPTSDTYETLAGLTGTETRNPLEELNIQVT